MVGVLGMPDHRMLCGIKVVPQYKRLTTAVESSEEGFLMAPFTKTDLVVEALWPLKESLAPMEETMSLVGKIYGNAKDHLGVFTPILLGLVK